MQRVCIIGTGHVGLVTGACLAEMGNQVVCVDKSRSLVDTLKLGIVPFMERGLEPIVSKNIRENRLEFTCDLHYATQVSQIIFICVDTPTDSAGYTDLTNLKNVYNQLENESTIKLSQDRMVSLTKIVIIKSTVPLGTARGLQIKPGFRVVSNPEFLRQGHGVYDFMNPDRIVIGTDSDKVLWDTMVDLYEPIIELGEKKCQRRIPIIKTSHETAELAKQVANAFIGVKISFINEIAHICAKTGANVEELAQIVGADHRIGPHFLQPGPGFGGTCLVKDIHSLLTTASQNGCELRSVVSAIRTNEWAQSKMILNRIDDVIGLHNVKIAVLGLAYKAGTNDTTKSPAVGIIKDLQAECVDVVAYDPVVNKVDDIECTDDLYKNCKNADMLLILTEWPEFRDLDYNDIYNIMKKKIIFDTRNLLNPGRMRSIGFQYMDNGRTLAKPAVSEEKKAPECVGTEN